jgi:Enoyl-(Acyl carrier protein) reductase
MNRSKSLECPHRHGEVDTRKRREERSKAVEQVHQPSALRRVVKRLWGFAKVRYRGLAKNTARLYTAFALANLYLLQRECEVIFARALREPRDERTCGWVRTAMAERSAKTEAERRGISVEQVWRERAAIYPQNRVLEPCEVAQVIAFLCGDAAGGVNGEVITVALGGMW